jgi:hypothetical protein
MKHDQRRHLTTTAIVLTYLTSLLSYCWCFRGDVHLLMFDVVLVLLLIWSLLYSVVLLSALVHKRHFFEEEGSWTLTPLGFDCVWIGSLSRFCCLFPLSSRIIILDVWKRSDVLNGRDRWMDLFICPLSVRHTGHIY